MSKYTRNNNEVPIQQATTAAPYIKWMFVALAAILAVCMAFTATRVGVTGDEFLDNLNGYYALKYYADGDTTFVDYSQVPEFNHGFRHMKYYGVGFELWPSFAIRYLHLPEQQLYLFRHLLCAFWGYLLIIFTALTAKRLAGYKAAIFALLLMALTPVLFGLSFFATKDIPFAAGFAIASYAFISIFDTLPQFKIRHILLAILGIAIAVSIRIGGLMLPFHLVVFFILLLIANPEKRRLLLQKPYNLLFKSLGIGTLVVVAGCFLGLCFYPNFFYEGPVEHIRNAMTLVSKFPQRIPMIFEGQAIDSLDLPENYLLKSIFYTIPLFVFAGLLFAVANIRQIWSKYDKASLLFLVYSVAFPLFVISFQKANIYNGWRHETFVYYGAVVWAALGFSEVTCWFKTTSFYKIWKFAAPILIVCSFVPTFIWMVQNYKYSYAYYNALVKDPYLKFDLDYFETTQTILIDWIEENELKDRSDTVRVAVRNDNAVYYSQTRHYDNIKAKFVSFYNYADVPVEYTILSTHFMKKKFIKGFFPPKGTIHVETLYGHPIAAVVKRNNLDNRGFVLFNEKKISEAVVMLDSAYRYDPNNFGVWYPLGLAYFKCDKYEEALPFLKKAMDFELNEDETADAVKYYGLSCYYLERYDEALEALLDAEKKCQDNGKLPLIKAYIGLTYKYLENYQEAVKYLQSAVNNYSVVAGDLNFCKEKLK